MMLHRVRFCVVACGVATGFLAMPAESHAIFHWFRCCGLFNRPAVAPTVGFAPACDPCNPCAQQVVNYVPQTCYRTQCVTVPVTTFQPITTCDPCTGCPVTCMRPVVAYRRQVRLVPYTSYRLVASSACPTVVTVGTVGAACAGCAVAAPAAAVPSPSVPYYNGAAPVVPSIPSTGPLEGAPSLPPESAPGTSTFESNNSYRNNSAPPAEEKLKPIPDDEADKPGRGNPTSSPRLIDPDSRTTAYPVERAWGYTPVSLPERTARAAATAEPTRQPEPPAEQSTAIESRSRDDNGWRPSRR